MSDTATTVEVDAADLKLLLDYLTDQETTPENLPVVFAWRRLREAVREAPDAGEIPLVVLLGVAAILLCVALGVF